MNLPPTLTPWPQRHQVEQQLNRQCRKLVISGERSKLAVPNSGSKRLVTPAFVRQEEKVLHRFCCGCYNMHMFILVQTTKSFFVSFPCFVFVFVFLPSSCYDQIILLTQKGVTESCLFAHTCWLLTVSNSFRSAVVGFPSKTRRLQVRWKQCSSTKHWHFKLYTPQFNHTFPLLITLNTGSVWFKDGTCLFFILFCFFPPKTGPTGHTFIKKLIVLSKWTIFYKQERKKIWTKNEQIDHQQERWSKES